MHDFSIKVTWSSVTLECSKCGLLAGKFGMDNAFYISYFSMLELDLPNPGSLVKAKEFQCDVVNMLLALE